MKTEDDRLHLFGIRHHGPGSASAVGRALDALRPDVVLIEGPADATEAAQLADAPDMEPPVALLAYWEADPGLATFFPFAEYSPEWRAMRWALDAGRPFRFIDLPAMHTLAHLAAEKAAKAAPSEEKKEEEAAEKPSEPHPGLIIASDPIGYLARLAGESDGEAWWTRLIESGLHAPALFAAIEEAMTGLREAAGEADSLDMHSDRLWSERREAHMRLAIGAALKETRGPIAVVCGAWHVPALRRRAPPAEDRKLLKGMPRGKTVVAWSPWTDRRLAVATGYGAGVVSPGWFRHLWSEMERAGEGALNMRGLGARWQGQVAALLRAEGWNAGTADLIEAVRLAETLAALRGLSMPGLTEFRDATLATLCNGDPTLFNLIEERLVIGSRVGQIAADAPQPPLLADLALQQKRLRLKPEALDVELSLDLRSEAGLAKSALLHRLNLLRAPWGRLIDAGKSRGSFRERWILRWEPEFSVRLAEATVYGATVSEAASGAALDEADRTHDIPALAKLVERCLIAGLDRVGTALIRLVDERAVETSAVKPLIDAVPRLASVLRYGTARKMPIALLERLIARLAERSYVGLVRACRGLDADEARAMRQSLAEFDRAAHGFPTDALKQDWRRALKGLLADDESAAMLRGFAARALYDQDALGAEEVGKVLSRALSPAVATQDAAGWVEGFLEGAAAILLHDRALLGALDQWLTGLPEEDFVTQIPLLRRVTGGFDAAERRRLWDDIMKGVLSDKAEIAADDDADAFEAALPLLKTILGLR